MGRPTTSRTASVAASSRTSTGLPVRQSWMSEIASDVRMASTLPSAVALASIGNPAPAEPTTVPSVSVHHDDLPVEVAEEIGAGGPDDLCGQWSARVEELVREAIDRYDQSARPLAARAEPGRSTVSICSSVVESSTKAVAGSVTSDPPSLTNTWLASGESSSPGSAPLVGTIVVRTSFVDRSSRQTVGPVVGALDRKGEVPRGVERETEERTALRQAGRIGRRDGGLLLERRCVEDEDSRAGIAQRTRVPGDERVVGGVQQPQALTGGVAGCDHVAGRRVVDRDRGLDAALEMGEPRAVGGEGDASRRSRHPPESSRSPTAASSPTHHPDSTRCHRTRIRTGCRRSTRRRRRLAPPPLRGRTPRVRPGRRMSCHPIHRRRRVRAMRRARWRWRGCD